MRHGIRRFLIPVLAGIMICTAASADSWQGSVTAMETAEITAPADGLLTRLDLEKGQTLQAGTAVASVQTDRTFSPMDGTVATVCMEEGENAGETVLEIEPVSRYKVSCTVSGYAVSTPETTLVHTGETVYMRCCVDQSHRAVGFVKSVSGTEYEVEVTGGELFIGEAVNIFRDAGFNNNTIIGRGTVLGQEVQAVSGEGVIQEIRVKAGDRVERGQLLFTTSSSGQTEAAAETGGIVLEVLTSVGKTVKEGDALATVALSAAMEITVPEEDAASFREGEERTYIRGDDLHETLRKCTVYKVIQNTEDGTARVTLIPDGNEEIPIGLTVTVTDENPEN